MTETSKTPTDFASHWMQWQQDFWKDWMQNASKGMEKFTGLWSGHNGKEFAGWQENWMKSFTDALSGSVPGEGLGADVFGRTMEAGKIYTDLLGFWTKVVTPLTQLAPGTPLTAEKIEEMHRQWNEEYGKMMEAMWGSMPEGEVQDTAKSVAGLQKTILDYMWQFYLPLSKNLEEVPEILEKAAKGESGALIEMAGLFRRNYEATMGKALKAPSMGYSREFIDNFNKTLDAYFQFQAAMTEYEALFMQTGQKASEKVFARLSEFRGKEVSPETFKEFYRVWWTINEDTYQELFMAPVFLNLLQEVLRRGLTFRKVLDSFTDQLIEQTNLPSKKDMDEIYRAIYDLKKEIRWQARSIRQIEEHLGIELKKPAPSTD